MERFKSGDRVVFIGDSLVAQNYSLPLLIDYYKRNFPSEDIKFFNCGVSGGTADFAAITLDEDALGYDPNTAIIAFGANDSKRWLLQLEKSEERDKELSEAFEFYKSNIRELCTRLKRAGVRTILCTPAPYDEFSPSAEAPLKGGAELLSGYAAFIREYARENGIELADVHTDLTEALKLEKLFNPDRVHPTPYGYFHIAKAILASQGLDIGDPVQDRPAYFARWHESVYALRCLYAADLIVIRDLSLPVEDRIKKAMDYLEAGKAPSQYHENIARMYIKNKRIQNELKRDAIELFEKLDGIDCR